MVCCLYFAVCQAFTASCHLAVILAYDTALLLHCYDIHASLFTIAVFKCVDVGTGFTVSIPNVLLADCFVQPVCAVLSDSSSLV